MRSSAGGGVWSDLTTSEFISSRMSAYSFAHTAQDAVLPRQLQGVFAFLRRQLRRDFAGSLALLRLRSQSTTLDRHCGRAQRAVRREAALVLAKERGCWSRFCRVQPLRVMLSGRPGS